MERKEEEAAWVNMKMGDCWIRHERRWPLKTCHPKIEIPRCEDLVTAGMIFLCKICDTPRKNLDEIWRRDKRQIADKHTPYSDIAQSRHYYFARILCLLVVLVTNPVCRAKPTASEPILVSAINRAFHTTLP